VQCPELKDLPTPPSGRTGWPWTVESRRLPITDSAGSLWPRISVVTPSFNQGRFIEATIRSVLLQGYPDLEYMVLDGGSTDDSAEIIKKYSPWLSYWVSRPDSGQSDAINRGLERASGELATWINSDDLLYKNALARHAPQVGFEKNTVYVGFCAYIDQEGKFVSLHQGRVFSLEDLVRIKMVWRLSGNPGHIDQPAALFPRALARSVGGLDPDNHRTMDYELWGKLFLAGAKIHYTDIPFGMFREHRQQKTQDVLGQTRALLDTAAKLVRLADCFSAETKRAILAELDEYFDEYKKNYWRGTGRLAKIGLPRRIVNPIRNLKTRLRELAGRQTLCV
jgi:glycosyltransferase involved in cell wall biosynthesis